MAIFIPNATWGTQYPLYVPFGALAKETSYVSFGCIKNGPDMLSIVFGIPAANTAAAPAGIESPQKATLCMPPDTLMNRTVVPGAIVSALGSNAATLLPLPVNLTSTT